MVFTIPLSNFPLVNFHFGTLKALLKTVRTSALRTPSMDYQSRSHLTCRWHPSSLGFYSTLLPFHLGCAFPVSCAFSVSSTWLLSSLWARNTEWRRIPSLGVFSSTCLLGLLNQPHHFKPLALSGLSPAKTLSFQTCSPKTEHALFRPTPKPQGCPSQLTATPFYLVLRAKPKESTLFSLIFPTSNLSEKPVGST